MLPNYHTNDPCFCLSRCVPSTPHKPCPKKGNCFELGTVIIDCENSIGPCNETGTVPFTCFKYPCDNPTFTIVNKDEIKGITVDRLDKDGLEFTTDGTLEAYDKVEVRFKATCNAEDCEYKSDYGSVVIYIKNLCLGVVCEEGFACNKCNGICEELDPEVILGSQPSNNPTTNEIILS